MTREQAHNKALRRAQTHGVCWVVFAPDQCGKGGWGITDSDTLATEEAYAFYEVYADGETCCLADAVEAQGRWIKAQASLRYQWAAGLGR